jgi:glutamate carboxypeptidase
MTTALDPRVCEAYLTRRLPETLELLRQMVAINSFTANPEGVDALGQLTARAFAGLGFAAETVQAADPAFGRHLVLTRPGAGGPTIGMVSHLDTVFPPEEERRNQFAWREEGPRIYGPGTVDIKGGTALMHMVLDALRHHDPAAFDSARWVLLLNAAEERLAPDFGALCLERLAGARACLVFEGGRRVAGGELPLVSSRKGRATFRVSAEGYGAHAGNNHPEGANAILQLARAAQDIAALTDYARGRTVNVGTFHGGTVANRVPHAAEAEVELRAFDSAAFREALEAILAMDGRSDIASASGRNACRLRVALLDEAQPWPPNPATEELIARWDAAGALVGLRALPEQRGGLSDGNWLWRHIPTLDGLGPAGANAHCSERSPDGSKDQEFVLRTSFVPKALVNLLAIHRLISDGAVER